MKLIRNLFLGLLSALFLPQAVAQTYQYQPYRSEVRPTKNVILMISDGTSVGVISAARWYKIFNKQGNNLALDPHFCGTVKTYSSNAPIGDSAPTTSCYMTGMPQQTGNVAIYPPADAENDLVPVDPTLAYQPLATILEASRIEQNKAVGLVVTCEFTHATPADCAAHYHSRGARDILASQMAAQNLDVVFGGGTSFVSEQMEEHFRNKGIRYIKDDMERFRQVKEGKTWALFTPRDIPFDIDRDTTKHPALREMTQKAIDLLSQNENGFFLMVEGSKVDWGAHSNDAVACITEFLAFDEAVRVALDFAKKDGNTTVVVLSDHGNSGFTTGREDLKGYDKASISTLFAPVSKYQRTAKGMEGILLEVSPNDVKSVMKQYTDIDITDEELAEILASKNYREKHHTRGTGTKSLYATLIGIMGKRTYFGFTTTGHTAEEVFLAVYHPQGDLPIGMNTNIEINRYLFDVSGLQKTLQEHTQELFAKHTDVFKDCVVSIEHQSDTFPVLVVKKGKNTLRVPAYHSVASLNGKSVDIGSVVVYMDKTDTFYLPRSLSQIFARR